jgi:hypothetical protein
LLTGAVLDGAVAVGCAGRIPWVIPRSGAGIGHAFLETTPGGWHSGSCRYSLRIILRDRSANDHCFHR